MSNYKKLPVNDKDRNYKHNRSLSRQAVDWIKYTDFRSGNTVKDLKKLCSKLSNDELRDVWSTRDKTGLYPIHWAAINNRSEMIEFMASKGSSLYIKCKNKLLSDGSPLHLSALNGSLEAAATLLNLSQEENRKSIDSNAKNIDYMEQVDCEGMTPVMRCAAPRSKRMDTVRDLLRKNLWSLNARPAEMALYLISRGANWRKTEPKTNMNLFHLAIINNCDDIINLLLVIDRQLLYICADLSHIRNKSKKMRKNKSSRHLKENQSIKTSNSTDQLLKSDDQHTKQKSTSSLDVEYSSSLTKKLMPLVDDQSVKSSRVKLINITDSESTDNEIDIKTDSSNKDSNSSRLSVSTSSPSRSQETSSVHKSKSSRIPIPNSISPTDLAIVYGRVDTISLLWRALYNNSTAMDRQYIQSINYTVAMIESEKHLSLIKWKVFWSDMKEVKLLLKQMSLKLLLFLDLLLFSLIWLPTYVDSYNLLTSGFFFTFLFLTLTYTMRVVLRDPGYLQCNSVQYLAEMIRLLHDNSLFKQLDLNHNANKTRFDIDRNLNYKNSLRNESMSNLDNTNAKTLKTYKQDDNNNNSNSNTDAKDDNSQARIVHLHSSLVNKLTDATGKFDLIQKVRLLCHKCKCIRRTRSRHCNHCARCVSDFDHHCIYLGTCIGRNNRLDFMILFVMLTISSLIGIVLQLSIKDAEDISTSARAFKVIGLIWIGKYFMIGLYNALLTLRRACQGITMYEAIRTRRIRSIFGKNEPPKSHKAFSIDSNNSFWRSESYIVDTIDNNNQVSSIRQVLRNLCEFTNKTSAREYFFSTYFPDSQLSANTSTNLQNSSKIDIYKFV